MKKLRTSIRIQPCGSNWTHQTACKEPSLALSTLQRKSCTQVIRLPFFFVHSAWECLINPQSWCVATWCGPIAAASGSRSLEPCHAHAAPTTSLTTSPCFCCLQWPRTYQALSDLHALKCHKTTTAAQYRLHKKHQCQGYYEVFSPSRVSAHHILQRPMTAPTLPVSGIATNVSEQRHCRENSNSR